MLRVLAAVLLLLPGLPLAQVLTAPKAAAPGGDLLLQLEALTPGSTYRVQLRDTRSFGVTHVLVDFAATSADMTRKVTIPLGAVPGSQLLEFMETGRGGEPISSRGFSVLAPLALVLEPASAEPGRKVRVSASRLRSGHLTLVYAGVPVLGPVAVEGDRWEGTFIVPRDRPASMPATVTVTGTNTMGRSRISAANASFGVLAPSGLPPFRSVVEQAPPALVADGAALSFSGRLVQPDGSGTDGRTSFFWRSADGSRIVPLDGGVSSDADGSYVPRSARAPSYYMDGVGGGSGSLLGVVSDHEPFTGVRRDTPVVVDEALDSQAPPPPALRQFSVRVLGGSGSTATPLRNAYVYVDGAAANSFLDPATAPPADESDLWIFRNQLSGQLANLAGAFQMVPVHGCPISFASGFTDGTGTMDFLFDPDAARRLLILQATKDLGEIRVIDRGAPIPGVDVWQDQQQRTKLEQGAEVVVVLKVAAGHLGYGATGQVTEDGENCTHQSCPPTVLGYEETAIAVRFVGGTDEIVLDDNAGVATVEGSTIVVRLPPIPIAEAAPQHLRISGLQPPSTSGPGPARFFGMHSFGGPVAADWPNSVFSRRNQGRSLRFGWEAGFGQVLSARYTTPYGGAQFTFEGDSSCNLSGVGDYVAPLPDLTRMPVTLDGESHCLRGTIEVTLQGRPQPAVRQFDLCTRAPPAHLAPSRVSSVSVDARDTIYSGKMKLPASTIPVDDPDMREYEIPPLSNRSRNDGSFLINHHSEFVGFQQLDASTGHDVASSPTRDTDVDLGSFGFDEDGGIERLTVLDTGRIPLFRYPWGFSPIAGAVFGADFWLAASLAFYGHLGNEPDSMMNATVDPKVEGGVDVFFDLDVLFGLVSASVTANTHLELSMKQKIGKGGRNNETYGECFGFDVGVTMEICAVFCEEDSFPLFSVTEPTASCRGASSKAAGVVAGFDLPRPQLRPAALAVDGAGESVVLEVDGANRLVARHLEGGQVAATHVLVPAARGIQHMDVAYHANGRALAVWSESDLTLAQLESLMTAPGAIRGNMPALARSLVLRWSWFDGSAWSAPQRVAGSLKGVGKPRLAAGPCTLLSCYRSGRPVYLVWEFDRAQNLDAPDLEVWGAQFSAGSFSGAVRISGTGATSDMHPTVAWVGGDPLVAWVSSPLPHYRGASERRIHYRVVDDPSGGRLRSAPGSAGLPAGAGWPALAARGSSGALLAYTVAQDDSVVGNRNALHVAEASCSGTQCSFTSTELRDPAGRQYRVERPSVALDAAGNATIGFRGLAFGPDANGQYGRPTDPLGMLVGTGEFMKVNIGAITGPVTTVGAQGLSGNALQHWRPLLVFDAAQDAFIGISRTAALPAGKHAALELARRYAGRHAPAAAGAKALGDGGLTLHAIAPGPDFRIEAATLGVPYLTGGAQAPVQVALRNVGSAYDPAVHGTAYLHAAWDAPPGAGVQASAPVALSALAANGQRLLNRSVLVPADHASDQRRTLFLEVRTDASTQDANAADNLGQASSGAMPVPVNLTVLVREDSPVMLLQWDAPEDPRIAGYRVYKRAENGQFVPYGSSPETGYADLFAGFRDVEEYRVTSYSYSGIESDPSGIAIGVPRQTTGLFEDGFEALVQ